MSGALWQKHMGFVAVPCKTFVGLSVVHRRVCLNRMPARTAFARSAPRASIEKEVSQRMKEAMKNKDKDTLKALRGIRAAFLTALKEEGAGDSLPDEVAIAQLRKLAKMRKESIAMFQQGARDDLALAEQKDLAIIEHWLPSLADSDQTTVWVKEAIEKTGASKKGDMGKVMGVIMKEHRQEVDGSLVKKIVSGFLA